MTLRVRRVPLNLIFMGTPEFALPALRELIACGHHIKAVYTAPPRPRGRGQKETLTPVHAYALEQGLQVFTPVSLKSEDAQQQLRAHEADAVVVAAYGLLLPPPVLSATRLGCINIHPSLLPRWRGAAPIQRTIMAGDKESGVVIMQMNTGLDTGDMLMTKRHAIPDGTTSGQLHDALAQLAAPLLIEVLEGLSSGTLQAVVQPQEGVTYAHKITPADYPIDWKQDAVAIRQKILGLNPLPGATFNYNSETIKCQLADYIVSTSTVRPGTVLDDQLTIRCGKDAIRPTWVQRPGKKPMQATDMLRGYPIRAGEMLG